MKTNATLTSTNEEPTSEGWVNVYPIRNTVGHTIYATKSLAKLHASDGRAFQARIIWDIADAKSAMYQIPNTKEAL